MGARSAVAALLLALPLAPTAALCADLGPSADTQALRQLIADFERARRANDKEAMRRLYTEDASYFQKSGREAFGNSDVIELLFARSLATAAGGGSQSASASANGASARASASASSSPAAPPRPARIAIDAVEAGGRLGMIYGRVCADAGGGRETCGTRWLLVTRKGDDGRWRIRTDIDTERRQ